MKNNNLIICIAVLAGIVFIGTIMISYYIGKTSQSLGEVEVTPTSSPEKQKYDQAVQLFEQGMYLDAANLFFEITTYEDAMGRYHQSLYELGKKMFLAEEYDEAKAWFEKISGYQDADTWILECDYNMASGYYREKEYKKSMELFEKISDFKDSADCAKKCREKMKQASEYLQVGYVVNDSQEEADGKYFTNGKGTLKFISDIPLDGDWVGVGNGRFVTYTMPQATIKFRLTNNGTKSLKNPIIRVKFDGVWLKTIPMGWEGTNHVHGVGCYAGAKRQDYESIHAGASQEFTLDMYEAYFANGKSANMTITVSADNYKQHTYKVKLKLK